MARRQRPVLAVQRPRRRALKARNLYLGLFRHLQSVVDLNPEVPHGTFEFRVAK